MVFHVLFKTFLFRYASGQVLKHHKNIPGRGGPPMCLAEEVLQFFLQKGKISNLNAVSVDMFSCILLAWNGWGWFGVDATLIYPTL